MFIYSYVMINIRLLILLLVIDIEYESVMSDGIFFKNMFYIIIKSDFLQINDLINFLMLLEICVFLVEIMFIDIIDLKSILKDVLLLLFMKIKSLDDFLLVQIISSLIQIISIEFVLVDFKLLFFINKEIVVLSNYFENFDNL